MLCATILPKLEKAVNVNRAMKRLAKLEGVSRVYEASSGQVVIWSLLGSGEALVDLIIKIKTICGPTQPEMFVGKVPADLPEFTQGEAEE